ncbi:Cilia- and flagella-associated protein 91, partial [Borealophlyctis nickersoniae]
MGQDRRVFHSDAQVTGANRYKYFRRPIVPYVPSLGGQVVYARRPAPVVRQAVEREVEPPVKTIGVQTMYRESEAQTDPYSPEYTLHPSSPSPPELLALATLTYGVGLPVGMAELEMIERARAKRAWEASLPLVVDQESFEVRLRMMEEMELKEWEEREEEIRRLQEARLDILARVIKRREAENEAINNDRIEHIWQRKLQERDAVLEKIQKKRIKALRMLTDKRNKVEQKIERRDIIADYANYSSKVYAPKARDGVFQDKASTTLRVKLDELGNYQGLVELETTFPQSVLKANTALPESKEKLRTPNARRELHMQEQLRLMDQKLKDRKSHIKAEDAPLRFAQRIEKPPRRPPTPVVQSPREEDEEMEVAALLLQKLIRGRIAQNAMYQGKERRLNLINELRTRQTIRRAQEAQGIVPISRPQTGRKPSRPVSAKTAAAREAEAGGIGGGTESAGVDVDGGAAAAAAGGAPEGTQIEGLTDRIGSARSTVSRDSGLGVGLESDIDVDEDDAEDEEVLLPGAEPSPPSPIPTPQTQLEMLVEGTLQAEYVGRTLDFLTKELVRLREERRIAAMVKLAERTRRMREAEESGRRQAEIKRRREEDEIFRQIMQVHQETVESYLEDIVAESVDRVASSAAREQVREYARKINEVVDEIERRQSTVQGEDMTVADLVASFLIPEVEKETLRSQ